MTGEGLLEQSLRGGDSPQVPNFGIYVSFVNWCIPNKEAVRVVLFSSLWHGTLYKWPLHCAPIFSSVSFMYPSSMLHLSREKIYNGYGWRPIAYMYAFYKGLRPRLYILKRLNYRHSPR